MPPKKKPKLRKGRNVIPITIFVQPSIHADWKAHVKARTRDGERPNGSLVFRDLLRDAIERAGEKSSGSGD